MECRRWMALGFCAALLIFAAVLEPATAIKQMAVTAVCCSRQLIALDVTNIVRNLQALAGIWKSPVNLVVGGRCSIVTTLALGGYR